MRRTNAVSLSALVYGAIAVIALLLGGASYFSIRESGAVASAYARQLEFRQLGQELAAASDLLTNEVRAYAQFGERAHYDNYWREVKETKTRDRVVARLGELGAPPSELALLDRAKANSDALISLEDSAMKLVARGHADVARQILFGAQYRSAKAAIMSPVSEFQAALSQRTEAEVLAARSGESVAARVLVAALVLAVALMLGGYTVFRLRFAVPIRKLSAAAEQIARGRIDVSVDVDARDELGVLADAFRTMVGGIRDQVLAVERMAAGDLDVDVGARSDDDVLSRNRARLRDILHGLVNEVEALVRAAQRGELSRRADVSTLQGAYRALVEGVNQTLDATTAPIAEATEVLERVAARDLTARVTGRYEGEHARIQQAVNGAVANLERALGDVATAAEQVGSSSAQIAAGSQSLAQGSSEQASSLEEASSGLHEMSSMIRQSAGNAREARGMADEARASATRGVANVRELGTAMDHIKRSSDATAKIVKTIDEIAFQTNLLALNAAVEAARAGEAGKGFAVVAEEVRNLAMRSAEAAKSTAALIEESVQHAGAGVGATRDVMRDLEEIEQRVNRVSAVLAEIAAATEQQTSGIEQLNVAVEQMNGVTQTVAANAEEAAGAAAELAGQATHMRALVGDFTISQRAELPEPAAVQASVRRPRASAASLAAARRGAPDRPARAAAARAAGAEALIPFEDAESLDQF